MTANGASLSVRSRRSLFNQSSNTPDGRAFRDGNEPTTPARQAAQGTQPRAQRRGVDASLMTAPRFKSHTVTFDCWQTLIYEQRTGEGLASGRVAVLQEATGALPSDISAAFASACAHGAA